MTQYGERDLWAQVNVALDTYQDDRTPENRMAYQQALDEFQANRRASTRRAIARTYGDDSYLQQGDVGP